MAILALCIEPLGSIFDNVTHPVEGFDIIY